MEMLGSTSMLPAVSSAAADRKTRFYVLETKYLRVGSQLARVNELMSKGVLPALAEIHAGPKIFLEALVAPHMPQFVSIYGYESLEEMMGVRAKLMANEALMKRFAEMESGPEPLVEHQSSTLLEAAAYSPEIAAPANASEQRRIFELRVYHSPTWRQLRALHERFAGPEIKIFHRVGVRPIFYSSTVIGANMPNLTYMIPFDNLAAREKAWAAFGADPEWAKVRAESIEKHGQISSVIQISLYRATAYSPIR